MIYSEYSTDGKTMEQINEMSYISYIMQESPSHQRTSSIVCSTVSSTPVNSQNEILLLLKDFIFF